MPIPLAGVVVGALGAVVAKVFGFLFQFVAYKLARNIAVATGALLACAALTVTMAQAIKAALLLVRVTMPQTLAVATYFLPPNINQIIAVMTTIATARFIYSWSVKNLTRYTMHIHV